MLSSWFGLCPFFLIGLGRAEKLCLGKWGVQVGQTFPHSFVPHCPKMHWQEFVPMGQPWEEERLNPSASHKPKGFQVQSCGQSSSASCSWGMVHWGMMQNYPVALRRSLVNPLQSSQSVRDPFPALKLLYLPQCTSVWDLFGWGMETDHSVGWELLAAEDPKVVWWCRQEAVPMYLMEKSFKWEKLKAKNMLSTKSERIKWEWSLEPSHQNATVQQ